MESGSNKFFIIVEYRLKFLLAKTKSMLVFM